MGMETPSLPEGIGFRIEFAACHAITSEHL